MAYQMALPTAGIRTERYALFRPKPFACGLCDPNRAKFLICRDLLDPQISINYKI